MNKAVHRRIVALEGRHERSQVVGCEMCRVWSGMVLRDDDGNTSRPERCPDCGRVVPIWHELHLVGIPLDVV